MRGAMSLKNKQKASKDSKSSTPKTNKTKQEIGTSMKMQINQIDKTVN